MIRKLDFAKRQDAAHAWGKPGGVRSAQPTELPHLPPQGKRTRLAGEDRR